MNRRLLTVLTLSGLAIAYHGTLARVHHAHIADGQRELDDAYAEYEAATAEAMRTAALRQSVGHFCRKSAVDGFAKGKWARSKMSIILPRTMASNRAAQ